jgi:hypothetical protein
MSASIADGFVRKNEAFGALRYERAPGFLRSERVLRVALLFEAVPWVEPQLT